MELLNFEGQSVLDSRDVSQMIGKRHDHLVRDIDKYIDDIDQNPNLGNGSTTAITSNNFFIPSTYTLKNGRQYRNYLLTKQGCEFVANKMTGKKGNQFTAQYVSLFNSMKKTIETAPQEILNKLHREWNVPTTLSGALQLAANQQIQLEKQKPKVDYYDSQMRNPGLMTTTEIAKDFGWSASKLNKWLAAHHIIYKQGGHWVLYQKYCGEGYTQYEPFAYKKNNRQGIRNNLKWTQKGRKFIYDKLAEHDIHPTVEQLDLLEM